MTIESIVILPRFIFFIFYFFTVQPRETPVETRPGVSGKEKQKKNFVSNKIKQKNIFCKNCLVHILLGPNCFYQIQTINYQICSCFFLSNTIKMILALYFELTF